MTLHKLEWPHVNLERERKNDEAGAGGEGLPCHSLLRRFFALAPLYARTRNGESSIFVLECLVRKQNSRKSPQILKDGIAESRNSGKSP